VSDAAPPEDVGTYVEALLFIAERPLTTAEIGELAGVPRLHAEAALSALGERLQDDERGIRLQRNEDAWQLVTAPEVGARLAEYASREEARLSAPALEALAVVAYRQPCTRGDVERIRGVDSDYVLRSLLHRRLVVEQGRAETPGRPILYATGFDFMERFGLASLDDLPPLEAEVAERLAGTESLDEPDE
jgi:segregation and condensation protein B